MTKNTILLKCKELFYKQGYKDTTYVDICKSAEVSPGTITYFYQSKKILALDVYSDLLFDIKNKTKDFLTKSYHKYNLRIASALEVIIFTDLICSDENYRRFYYDICVDGLLLESYIDKMSSFYKLHSDEYHLGLSETELRLIQTTSTSISLGVTRKWIEGYLVDLTKEEYSNYKIRIMYHLMGMSETEIDKVLKKSNAIYQEMTIQSNSFFSIEITRKDKAVLNHCPGVKQ